MKKILTVFILISSNIVSAQPQTLTDSSYFTVRITSFDIASSNNLVNLHWKTACFIQYANFQIQKSLNGVEFTTINSFSADRLRCEQPFDFTDSTSTGLGNIYYRINVGNIDGKFYHSAIKHAYLPEKGFELTSVYPTIVSSDLNFSLSNAESKASFTVIIINQNGAVVKKYVLRAAIGISNYNYRVDYLSSGIYWLQVLNDKGELRSASFIKK